MKTLLAIESSAAMCSLALQHKGEIYTRQQHGQRSHTQFLLAFVEQLLADAKISVTDLDAIAFSAGPGSFTGVRLAASTAKALAYAAHKPVIAVSSLAIIAQGFYRQQPDQNEPCTIVSDAHMGELYMGFYHQDNGQLQALADDCLLPVIDADNRYSHSLIVTEAPQLLAGNEAFKQVRFYSQSALAIDVLPLAQKQLAQGDVSSALTAEAIYLRGKGGWKTTAQQQAEKAAKE